MPQIILDKNSFLRGLYSDRIGLATSQEAPNGYYVRSNGIDFHRVGYMGHPTTAQTFTAGNVANAAINSLPRAVAVDITASTPNVYYILGGLAGTAPRVVEMVNDAYSETVITITADAGDNFTTLPATGYWGEDIILYKVGTTVFVFYSWNDSDDGDVGRFALGGGSPDDDWMSTTAAGGAKLVAAVPHRMVEGSDGNLYITNGRYVAQFDGSNGAAGTLNATKYDLGVGWVATDIRRHGNYLAIAAVKAGAAYINYTFSSISRMTLWNMTEPGLGLVYDIHDNFVSAIYPADGNLYAFTRGRNNTVKVWKFTGQGFRLLWESAVYTGTPDPRSMELYKNLIVWAAGTSLLALDLDTEGIHQPFIANDGTTDVTTIGFIKNIDQSKLFMAGIFGANYTVPWLTFASTGFASGTVQFRTRLFGIPYNSTITKFTFYFSQLAASSSARFSLFRDYTTMSVGGSDDALNFTIDNATYGAIYAYELKRTITRAHSFYLNMVLAGQVSVRAVVIDYE